MKTKSNSITMVTIVIMTNLLPIVVTMMTTVYHFDIDSIGDILCPSVLRNLCNAITRMKITLCCIYSIIHVHVRPMTKGAGLGAQWQYKVSVHGIKSAIPAINKSPC